ncbi:hypothetical protein [Nereida ignava]|uniref:hypothetical protein n=1 Tax=Nereida ignava TaxID=282199 RepID=UPI002FE1E1E4
MTRILTLTALCALAASPTLAGGWETGKLDTSFLYEDGNYAELSYGSLNYAINATTQADTSHKMAKNQTRQSLSGKFTIGNIDVGITSFDSGAIQMDGQSAAADRGICAVAIAAIRANPAAALGQSGADADTNCSIAASADVMVNTQSILVNYNINDSFSVIGGLRKVNVDSSTVQTLKTNYALDKVSKSGMVYGAVYQIPDIALKFEIMYSEAIKMGLTGNASGLMAGSNTLPFASDSKMAVPTATTIKFQTGIAEDTLLMASAHRVNWAAAQIDVNIAANSALDVGSEFTDTTAYSIGLGRKFTEKTSGSLSYSWEKGAGATSGSGFTMSNGSKTLSLGLKHQTNNLTLSGGVSYTKVGDVDVSALNGLVSAAYADNSVTAFGLKASFDF